ncbi:DNA helicase RecQ [Clostridium botulinum]|uniref:DNA helicase RecQ n=1 Tax=Clostridium botulinum C/D str. DC5 TaxID=1443128 RepID=A0A0A0IKX1_CLOBO|nr:DNA helicase RecQ [Clostridium botulinum]KGN01234.1 ATP-dependent DNA helicase RecQ [Clostridium botulinum C/D str. DC5]KOC53977.1 ATP-dependent DNA helicase RecQ [Clostridium botulinum]KOC57852.1 ATP-dependent DNA helicase RecQ [Clostridium botulinum]MCD3232874.1 DNA helicase RecQ [Clostridium botulinum D/C]MCD3238734.1 DNA helicase RecQ [Clostridium botulinum D/C]
MNITSVDILEKYYGYKSFRKGQQVVIESILEGKDVLAIMPTGGGKSICYQIPALMMSGMTIVISPLISLMKDQVDSIKTMGISCAYVNSTLNTYEFDEVINGIKNNKYKIIYIAPERLESLEFYEAIKDIEVSQIAIDEAHCVSQWGHDFRVSYRNIPRFINKFINKPKITAFTATASEEVREDIIKLLKLKDPKIFITGFDRENLNISIIKSGSKKEYLLNYIENNKEQSGIIYAATRKEVDNIYEGLKNKGYSVGRYHAGLSDGERENNQEEFIHDRLDIMIATNAFGMGIDKPNIRYVVHYSIPKSIEAYYQEIGRAGRDGEKSECILLFAPGDVHIQKYLIEVSIENSERKQKQYEKLQEMIDLVYSNDCYRKYILNYFGEEFNQNCNNCSNCLNEGEIVDKTIDAQKVLSCIYKMKRNFGITMVVDVLRGSKNKKVLNLGFNTLSTYGLMKEYSQDKLKNFINTLVSHGYIGLIGGTYPVLNLNNRSVKVLKGEETVKFKVFEAKHKDTHINKLFNILKSLRYELASNEGVPPYVIFGDGTLREMSLKYPINKEKMLQVSGVGEVKYEKYGNEFVEIISRYVNENNINVNNIYDIQEQNDNKDVPLEVTTNVVLLKELLKIRNDFAVIENVLPQMVLSKNALKEISGRYPLNEENLKDVSGIGPKKIEKYGQKILEVVNRYVNINSINVNWIDKKRRKVIVDGDGRENNEIAMDMLNEGRKLKDISTELEVGVSTILGYITDYIKEGGKINFDLCLDELYTREEEKHIINVCEKVGYEKVSKIKKQLPTEIKYESIRAVILKNYYSVC